MSAALQRILRERNRGNDADVDVVLDDACAVLELGFHVVVTDRATIGKVDVARCASRKYVIAQDVFFPVVCCDGRSVEPPNGAACPVLHLNDLVSDDDRSAAAPACVFDTACQSDANNGCCNN